MALEGSATRSSEYSAADLVQDYYMDRAYVQEQVHTFLKSSKEADKLRGISIISDLINGSSSHLDLSLDKLGEVLQLGLPPHTADVAVMAGASEAIGMVAKALLDTMKSSFYRLEATRAMEWLTVPRDALRHASVLLLRALALREPDMFQECVLNGQGGEAFLGHLFAAICDAKSAVREAAVATLKEVLASTIGRDSLMRDATYNQVYRNIAQGLAKGKEDAAHGSLLALTETLQLKLVVRNRRQQLEVYRQALRFVDKGSVLLQRTAVSLVPVMAQALPEVLLLPESRGSAAVDDAVVREAAAALDSSVEVARDFLELTQELRAVVIPSMIAGVVKDKQDRATSYVAVGRLVEVFRSTILPQLSPLFTQLQQTLSNKRASAEELDAAYRCIAMLIEALGTEVTEKLRQLVEPMFSRPLGSRVVEALQAVVNHIPKLAGDVNRRLLQQLHLGLKAISAQQISSEDRFGEQAIVSVLHTLGTFDFGDCEGAPTYELLLTFARDGVLPILTSTNHAIREEASLTCARLLVAQRGDDKFQAGSVAQSRQRLATGATRETPDGRGDRPKHRTMRRALVNEVLGVILRLCVSDPLYSLRVAVLRELDSSTLDDFMVETENLTLLFAALNEDAFDVRTVAISVLGRLMPRKPADVMPHLRTLLTELLTDLATVGNVRREESIRLLDHLISSSPQTVSSHVGPIRRVLLPMLRNKAPGIVGRSLEAIGRLALAGGHEMREDVSDIMPVILEYLAEGASAVKRRLGVQVLRNVCQGTGYATDAYMDNPSLMPLIAHALEQEQAASHRADIVDLLGVLGAVDPHQLRARATATEETMARDGSRALLNRFDIHDKKGSDEFYVAVAVNALAKIALDDSLLGLHEHVMRALMVMTRYCTSTCMQFLQQIVPACIAITRTAHAEARAWRSHVADLGKLVNLAQEHIKPHLDDLILVALDVWVEEEQLLFLVERLAVVVGASIRPFLPAVLAKMRQSLQGDSQPQRLGTLRLLRLLPVFGEHLDGYLHFIVPVVVRLFQDLSLPTEIRHRISSRAMRALIKLSSAVSLRDRATTLVHRCATVLETEPDLRPDALSLLARLVCSMGYDYAHLGFVALINDIVVRLRLEHREYERCVACLVSGEPFPVFDSGEDDGLQQDPAAVSGAAAPVETPVQSMALSVNQEVLRAAWNSVDPTAPSQDWRDWLKRLNKALIRESTSPALKACSTVAELHPEVARELFQAAFVSCWPDLYEDNQEELVEQIERALTDTARSSREIKPILLGLAEVMEFTNKGRLPIPEKMLGQISFQIHAFAKALHYKEREFYYLTQDDRARDGSYLPTADIGVDFYTTSMPFMSGIEGRRSEAVNTDDRLLQCVRSLVEISNSLQVPDAAAGLLERLQDNAPGGVDGAVVKPDWFEKLGKWEEALAAYDQQLAASSGTGESVQGQMLGRMRCLHEMGEWGQLHNLFQTRWDQFQATFGRETLQEAALIGCWAAFASAEWDDIAAYVEVAPLTDGDSLFFKAIIALRNGEDDMAFAYVNRCRKLLGGPLARVLGESYGRAFDQVVKAQMLTEVEEIITYRNCVDSPERRETLRRMWDGRLQGCKSSGKVWQQVIQLRSLVIEPQEMLNTQLEFARISLDEGWQEQSHAVLVKLLRSGNPHIVDPGVEPDLTNLKEPTVGLALLEHQWRVVGPNNETLSRLERFTSALRPNDDGKMLSKCHFILGTWSRALEPDASVPADGVIDQFSRSAAYDPTNHTAWRTWAYLNYMAATADGADLSSSQPRPDHTPRESQELEERTGRAANAINGYFRCISLHPEGSLQDALRLLGLWFSYGWHPRVNQEVAEGRATVSLDTWLPLLPQLIARVDTQDETIQQTIHHLLLDVGKHHPQAVIMPLTVATQSTVRRRKQFAEELLRKMERHSKELVAETTMVCEELNRAGSQWFESWHATLQEASRLYYDEKDPAAMLEVLEPAHDMLDSPKTPSERAFVQAFRLDLVEAREWTNRYRKTRSTCDINAAWALYLQVFKRIAAILPKMAKIDLKQAAPRLLAARGLKLVMPGTYQVGAPLLTVESFHGRMEVIGSKQRPRICRIRGHDGKTYQYLLKCQEDPRMDERVMAFFGLVNTLLASVDYTAQQHLSIVRYSITPLSPTSGLIGWVKNTDTLHSLIRQQRQQSKVPLHAEHGAIRKMSPESKDTSGRPNDNGFYNLAPMQKCEVFLQSIACTPGDDLANALWLKSPDAETWLLRRTNYTRSMAVMSMVGHVLGLGDRHPSNIMIKRYSGHVVHIDFGDCFEAAQIRAKFPEKVPFRLTRVMTQAMEVSGIKGTYRVTSEGVMRVLREHKESLLAVLEAFVHDPLLAWDVGRPKPEMESRASRHDSVSEEGEAGAKDPEEEGSSFSSGSLGSGSGDSAPLRRDDESLRQRAVEMVHRVELKLAGREFHSGGGAASALSVEEQVQCLISKATDPLNLSQMFTGSRAKGYWDAHRSQLVACRILCKL